MKRKVRLTESDIHRIVKESVKRVLREGKYNPNAAYIVFDGTSYYAVPGMDVEDEIANNDVEVVRGPFPEYNDRVEDIIADLNDEAYGVNTRIPYYMQ